MNNNKMREIRKEKGITLGELSISTGISVGYLCHLERGTRKNPSMHIMALIAEGLNKTIIEVFFSNLK